jgi:hypothetical protein
MTKAIRPGWRGVVRELPFRLPAGARQGPRTWYLFKLHYRLVIDQSSGTGLIWVNATSNGRAMALLTFRTARRGGKLRVRSTQAGLVAGSKLEESKRTTWDGVYTNFFTLGGVRPGRSRLTIGVFQEQEARVRSLRVFADSGIIVTRNGPASVELVPVLHDRDIRVGEEFRVGYRVESVGESAVPAGGTVTIGAVGLKVVGARSALLGRIPAGKNRLGFFRLVADRPGTFPISLQVSSWGGTPVVQLAAHVSAATGTATSPSESGADSRSASWIWLSGLAATLAGVAIVVVVLFPRRVRPKGP